MIPKYFGSFGYLYQYINIDTDPETELEMLEIKTEELLNICWFALYHM